MVDFPHRLRDHASPTVRIGAMGATREVGDGVQRCRIIGIVRSATDAIRTKQLVGVEIGIAADPFGQVAHAIVMVPEHLRQCSTQPAFLKILGFVAVGAVDRAGDAEVLDQYEMIQFVMDDPGKVVTAVALERVQMAAIGILVIGALVGSY